MSEIADEFKVVVVEAIKALCLKFPQVGARKEARGAGLGAEQGQGTCKGACAQAGSELGRGGPGHVGMRERDWALAAEQGQGVCRGECKEQAPE